MLELDKLKDQEASSAPDGWVSPFSLVLVANFRDLAGADPALPAYKSGKEAKLRRGMLFRTGVLNGATATDLMRIRSDLGIKTYMDLRSGEGVEGYDDPIFEIYGPQPSQRSAAHSYAPGQHRCIHIHLIQHLGERPFTDDEVAGKVPPEDKKAQFSYWYQKALRSEEYGSNKFFQRGVDQKAALMLNDHLFLTAMKELLNKENYPIAFGCTAGRDRTGLLAWLVLSALDVDVDTVLEDYLFTNRCCAHLIAVFHQLMKRDQGRDQLKEGQKVFLPLMPVSAQIEPLWKDENIRNTVGEGLPGKAHREIFDFFMSAINEDWGGAKKYLEAIGFGPQDMAQLRDLLTEPV